MLSKSPLRFLLQSDILLPLLLILAYVVMLGFLRGVFPTGEELVRDFATFYREYGYLIIFVSAFLEGLVLINFLVPGSLGMALGAIFAKYGSTDLVAVIAVAVFGSLLAYLVDYLLGYWGFSDLLKKIGYGGLLNTTQKSLKRLKIKGLIIGFINPNVGSYLSLVAGATKQDFPLFYGVAVISTIVWFSIWAILFYTIGSVLLEVFTKYSFLVGVVSIGGYILFRLWSKKGE